MKSNLLICNLQVGYRLHQKMVSFVKSKILVFQANKSSFIRDYTKFPKMMLTSQLYKVCGKYLNSSNKTFGQCRPGDITANSLTFNTFSSDILLVRLLKLFDSLKLKFCTMPAGRTCRISQERQQMNVEVE
jgi:hypothetical protein